MNKQDLIKQTFWQPSNRMPDPWNECDNAHCWVLSQCLQMQINNTQKLCDSYMILMKQFNNANNKQDLLEQAFNYLKDNLTTKERKFLKIPDTLWQLWTKGMLFCIYLVFNDHFKLHVLSNRQRKWTYCNTK